MRSFDLYASNNSVDWTLLGQFDIGDPSDENGNIPQDFIDAAAAMTFYQDPVFS